MKAREKKAREKKARTMSKTPKRNTRYKYTKETLRAAMEAVQAGMTLNAASIKYQVPRSTLLNRKRANFADLRPGPDTILTEAEEEGLVTWIHECYDRGLFIGKQQLLNSVAALVTLLGRKNPFANGRPGRHWFEAFLKRHENIGDRLSRNASLLRSPVTEEGIKSWFTNTRLCLERKNLLNVHPSRIFVMETTFLLSPDTDDGSESLPVHVACNAAGQMAPCMLLFKYQRVPPKVYEKMPQDWVCAKSESGLMNPDLFFHYVTKTFSAWLCRNKLIELPVVLFVDGKIPFVTVTLTDFCSRNNIELMALHPNASGVLNPLQKSLFPQLKNAWKHALQNHRLETMAKVLLNEDVSPCLKIVIDGLDIAQIMTSGFEQCGLYPLSEDNCKYQKIVKKTDKKEAAPVELVTYLPDELFSAASNQEVDESYLKTLSCVEELIDKDTLKCFKDAGESGAWRGRVEDTSLFNLWKTLSNICQTGGNVQQNNYEGEIAEVGLEEYLLEDPLKMCSTYINTT